MLKLAAIVLFCACTVYAQDLSTVRNADLGERIAFSGTVTSAGTLGRLVFIEDATAGIGVYDSAFAASVEVGDIVSGTGVLTEFGASTQGNGLLELTEIHDIEIEDSEEVLPSIIEIATINEQWEGRLVQVVAHPQYAYPGCMQGSSNVSLRSSHVSLWIDNTTDVVGMPIPTTTCTITGVVTEWQGQRQITLLSRDGVAVDVVPNPTFHSRIMSLNSWFLGSDSLGAPDDSLQIEIVADIVQQAEVSIIALQEVQTEWAITYLLDLLPEFEAVYATPLRFQNNVILHRTTDVSRTDWFALETPGKAWPGGRQPLVTEFVDNQWNAFRLVNIHAKAGSDVDDWEWRKSNASELMDTIALWDNRAVLVVGDINDLVHGSISQQPESPYASWSELGNFVSKDIEYTHTPSGSAIDHVFLLENGHRAVATARALYPQNTENYCLEMSDHLPVLVELSFSPPSSVNDGDLHCPHQEVVVYSILGREVLRGTRAFIQTHAPRNQQLILVSNCRSELVLYR